MQFRLHPVGPVLTGGMLVWPRSRAGEVLRFWRDYVETAPDDFGSAPAFLIAPPAPFVPEHLQGQPAFGLIVCCAGAPEDGDALVKPFREFAPDLDMVGPVPYAAIQMLIDDATPHGLHNYWKAENLPELSDAAHTLYCFSMWTDPAESDTHIAWTRSLMDTMAQFTMPGVSLNFTSEQTESKAKESFGSAEKLRRLTALKDQYDPTNFFRLNQNIRPSSGA